MVFPSVKSVDQFLLFLTHTGGLPLERVKSWTFELGNEGIDCTEIQGWGPSSLHGVLFIPATDFIEVRAALRSAAERMREVLSVGRSWRTTEEILSNAMAGGKSYGHAQMPPL